MVIVIISTASLETPPVNFGYGGIELESWLLARGLAERGHAVTLLAKEGSRCPRHGRLIEMQDEHDSYKYIEKYIGRDGFDVVIDYSHDKAMSVAHPEWPQLNVHQVMSIMGNPINPVLISHGQWRTKMPNVKCEIVFQHIDLYAYDPNYVLPHPHFITMAQIIEEKRIDWSIDVALKTGFELRVFGPWWGNPQYMDSLRRMAEGHRNIKLSDSIGGGDKIRELREAKALLHFPGAKDFCEAGSIITLEALASGTPVIVSDNGVHREYVRNGYNGYIVNSVQEAVDLIQDGYLERIDRENCRRSVEWAHYPAMAMEYEKLCQRVANGERWNV